MVRQAVCSFIILNDLRIIQTVDGRKIVAREKAGSAADYQLLTISGRLRF